MKLLSILKELVFPKNEINKNRLKNDEAIKDLMRWGNYMEVRSRYI